MLKQLEFGKMEFQDSYVICTIDEGVDFSTNESDIQTQEILNYYNNKPFVYITNRVNSYSVNPFVYIKSCKIDNLQGFAVVNNNNINLNTVEVEKCFFKDKPFEAFTDLSQALEWAKNLVQVAV